MRRALGTTVLCLAILVVLFPGTALGSIAKMASEYNMKGVRADITTPSSQLSGIVNYTTVKGLVGTEYGTNTGFLVRPPTYPHPMSYYVWYNSSGVPTEVILSTQSYGSTRAYEIANHDTGYLWTIYIVGSPRHTSYDVYNSGTVSAGAATSNSSSNIWSRVSTFQGRTTPAGSYYNFVNNSQSVYDSSPVITSPLAINVYSANHHFVAYKP
jgi:hypothetical protein